MFTMPWTQLPQTWHSVKSRPSGYFPGPQCPVRSPAVTAGSLAGTLGYRAARPRPLSTRVQNQQQQGGETLDKRAARAVI